MALPNEFERFEQDRPALSLKVSTYKKNVLIEIVALTGVSRLRGYVASCVHATYLFSLASVVFNNCLLNVGTHREYLRCIPEDQLL